MVAYCVVNSGVIVYGPEAWLPDYFAAKLNDYGVNVSLPGAGPAEALRWEDVAILPVVEIGADCDSRYQLRSPGVGLIDGDVVRITYAVTNRPTADVVAEKVVGIKAECGSRILGRYPQYVQLNMTSRAIELVRKGEANWSPAEAEEAATLDGAWAWIKAMRAHSNALESSLDAMPLPQLGAFAPDDDANWSVDP